VQKEFSVREPIRSEAGCGGGGHGEVYSPYLRLSLEGPQMAIAQIEVQVKRNPMKTLAQINNRVNNLGLEVSSDPEVCHRRMLGAPSVRGSLRTFLTPPLLSRPLPGPYPMCIGK
jgi:hypothetical protein